jgi:hypothetical protein
MRLCRLRFVGVSVLALAVVLTPSGNAFGTVQSSAEPIAGNGPFGLGLTRVIYNDTVIWRAFRYNLPALIFDVPPDPDGDQWAFAHILEHNRMAIEYLGTGDMEPLRVFAGSLDEGGGPLQGVTVNASPEILPFVEVVVFDFSIVVTTTQPVELTTGFIEVHFLR